MDIRNAVNVILHDATGKKASGREMLVSQKKSILDAKTATALKEQWNGAGRDNALVAMRLTEADGSNPHYVTGWDGKDTFVCMTEAGLTYVNQRKLEKLVTDQSWNPTTRLIEVRAPLLQENLEKADIEALLDRIRKTLTKSGKDRRRGRLKNTEKFFSVVGECEDAKKTPPGGKSGTEFVKLNKKDDRVPSTDPPGRNESYVWDKVDASGRPVRRNLTHPMMRMESNKTEPQLDKRQNVLVNKESKGGSGAATPGGNKTEPQLDKREIVTVHSEDNQDPQVDKRELVDVRKEAPGTTPAATPGGNKTELEKRALVRTDKETASGVVRSEASTDSSADKESDEFTTYAGEKGKSKEFASRPKITVRHEAITSKKGKTLFGPGIKHSPEGAKKPLLMLVLMAKGKKQPMSEASVFCPRCGQTHHTKRMGGRTGPMLGLAPSSHCPTCERMRTHGGPLSGKTGGLDLNVEFGKKSEQKPKDACDCESTLSRSSLNLIEAKRPLPPEFLANIEKMKARAKARRAEKLGQSCC